MIATPGATPADRRGGRPPRGRILLAIAMPVLVAFASLGLGIHSCDRGIPVLQWAIPCVAMASAMVCIRAATLRRVTAVALAVCAIGLSGHFASSVHAEGIVGSTSADCTVATALWHTPLTGFYAAQRAACADERAAQP